MRNAAVGKAFFGYKWIVGSVLLLLLVFAAFAASAQAMNSFSGRVWNDLNNDGLIHESEPGVSGVTLTLRRADTGEILTAVSDEAGLFLFASLPNDSYQFSVQVPQSMLFARYRKEGGDLRSVLTGEDNDITRSFVLRGGTAYHDMNIGLVDSAIVKGMAFLDVNYNGQYDEGEPPYPGVAMEVIRNASDRSLGRMYTDENGLFLFDSVRAGNYRLRAILPDDGSTFSHVPSAPGFYANLFAARPGRRENSIPSVDTENSMVYEYYVGVALGGTVTGTVFFDQNYSGVLERSDRKLNGVTVQLVSGGAVVTETKSNNTGGYTFSGVMPGEYTLRFLRKSGYTFTKYRPLDEGGSSTRLSLTGEYGETASFSFAMGDTLADLNAGLVQSATLGGIFFHDANDNGLMDAGESGFTDGRVRLLSEDGEIDITQTVGADGHYDFSGVVPTRYTLYYLLPEHAEMAKVVKGGNTLPHQGAVNAISDLTLQAKKEYTQPLVGAVKLGTFEGVAFTDWNANGTQDGGETPLAGVTVSIKPQDAGNIPIVSTTGTDGLFSITGLRPGDYILAITLPEGMIFAGAILASGIPLDATDTYARPVLFDTLLGREDNGIGAVAPAAIEASVWLDENLNGAQDAGERMLDGLEYALYDEVHETYIMTARAGIGGTAVFYNVRPSTYTVSFDLPADAQPVTGMGTFTQSGGTMRQSGIAIHAGDLYTEISGGLQCTTSIGGAVEVDQTDHRSPVAGVEVRLYAEGNSALLQSAVTDAQGVYRFNDLWPGRYVIEVIRPAGYVFIRPNDPAFHATDSMIRQINDEFGTGDPFSLEMAQDQLAHRVLLTSPAKIGNLVWLDENQNGLIDGEEPMISGVSIHLTQDGATIDSVTSNAWGYYEFSSVYPGTYTLEAVAYPQLSITQSLPALRIISNCLTAGDGNLATSEPFSVTSGSVNFFYHLGYVLKEGEITPPAITEGETQVWTRP